MSAPSEGGPRLIVANLDCDVAFARLSNPNGTPQALSDLARAVAAATGSLLRVFAAAGDRLRLCTELDPARLPGSLPSVVLVPRAVPVDTTRVLPWAMTPDVAAEVALSADAASGTSGVEPGDVNANAATDDTPFEQASIVDRPWRSPYADPEVTAATNHRGTALAIARELDVDLAEATLVSSVEALADHVRASVHQGEWVAKGAHSSAGRARVWITSPDDLDPGTRACAAIERLLRTHGSVLLEPWHDRVGDYAVNGCVTDEGWVPSGLTSTLVDARGGFRGVDLGASIPDPIARSLLDSSARVARALRHRGYRGPLGIDAWTYREGSRERLNVLGELNARLTFGHVAVAVREQLGLDSAGGWRLEVRRVPNDHTFSPTAIPLLLGGPPDDVAAWLALAR